MNKRFVSSSILILGLLAALGNPATAQEEEFSVLEPPQRPEGQPWWYNNFVGSAVALSSDWAFLGDYATMTGGEVYAYRRSPAGWVFTQRLDGGARAASFGSTIAVDGNSLVIGNYGWGDTHYYKGKVHVFELANGRWVLSQQIRLSHLDNPGDAPTFGRSVAIAGDVLAIGAPTVLVQDHNGVDRIGGAVFIYERNANGWAFAKRFRMPPTEKLSRGEVGNLGFSVRVRGDTILAGAPRGEGAVLVFRRGTGGWERHSIIDNPNPGVGPDGFGYAVAIDSTTMAIGCPGSSIAGVVRTYVYEEDSTGNWQFESELRTEQPSWDYFGRAVAIHDDRIAVGAPRRLENGNNVGAVYMFRKGPTGWGPTEDAEYRASDRNNASYYRNHHLLGSAVAMEGQLILAGAPNGITRSKPIGKAYFFTDPIGSPRDCRTDATLADARLLGSGEVGEADLELVARDLEPDGVALALLSSSFRRSSFGSQITCLEAPRVVLAVHRVSSHGVLLHHMDFDDVRSQRHLVPGNTVYFQVAVRPPDPRKLQLTNVVELLLE